MNNNKRRQQQLESRKKAEASMLPEVKEAMPEVTAGNPSSSFHDDEFSAFSEDEMSLLEEGKMAPANGKETEVTFAGSNAEDKTSRANDLFLSSISTYNAAADELTLRQDNDEYINEKTIHVRRQEERKHMANHKRVLTNVKITVDNLVDDVKELFHIDDHENNHESSANEDRGKCFVQSSPKQYHIEKRQIARGSLWDRCLSCIGIIRSEYGDPDAVDSTLQAYLQWTFHASFVTLFLSTFFIFIILIAFFSGLIGIAGYLKPTCVSPGMISFHDMYTLSWTTFTTVVRIILSYVVNDITQFLMFYQGLR